MVYMFQHVDISARWQSIQHNGCKQLRFPLPHSSSYWKKAVELPQQQKEKPSEKHTPVSPSCRSCCPIPLPQTRSTEPGISLAGRDVWLCQRSCRTWSACQTVRDSLAASWWTPELCPYASPMHRHADKHLKRHSSSPKITLESSDFHSDQCCQLVNKNDLYNLLHICGIPS